MNIELHFFKTLMPESRKADFYLGCLDGAVFMDFNISSDNIISLVRISFDGYGCCTLDGHAKCLTITDSQEFLNEIEKEILHQERMAFLIKEIIKINQDLIWKDALEEYGLLCDVRNRS